MLEVINDVIAILLAIISSIGLGLFSSLRRANKTINRLGDELERLESKCSDGEHDISYYKKLLHNVTEQAHRNGAIAEGLAADLAALKEYNPEEVEEKLRKIHEIRAEEERIRQMRATGTLGLGLRGPLIWDGQRWLPLVAQVPYDGRVSTKDFTDALAQMTNAYGTTLWADNQAVTTIRN